MALQIKQGFNLQDQSGTNYDQAYAVIDRIIADKKAKEVLLYVTIYRSQQDRIDGKTEINEFSKIYKIDGDSFDQLFSPEALIQNINQWSQGYEFLKTLENFINFENV